MNVQELIVGSIGLSVNPATTASFNVPMLLVDSTDIPLDRKYIQVTRSSYATDLTASTAHLAWCQALWSQNYTPVQAYLGRWVNANTEAYNTFPNAEDDPTVWAALAATGKFELDDGVNQEDITPDFTGDTTMALVCASIQTALGASTNFSGYTCSLDALDRITIYGSVAGAAAPDFATGTPGSGVDLSGSAYLGTEVAQSGLDAEALGTAMNRVLAVTNEPFIMCQIGGSIAQVVAFSTAVNALDKILLLNCTDTDAKDSSSTTDFPYQIEALSHNKTHMTYTEHSTQYPDAAIIGEILTRLNKEGSTQLANNPLTGLSESGLDPDGSTVVPLTLAERSALEAKGCDYLIQPSNQTHLRNGLAAGGNEMRVMIGKSFLFAKIAEAFYGYLVANPVVTYSDAHLQALLGIAQGWVDEMITRELIDGDSVVWNWPSAADITAAQKASHTLTLSDVFDCNIQSAVNDIALTATFTV